MALVCPFPSLRARGGCWALPSPLPREPKSIWLYPPGMLFLGCVQLFGSLCHPQARAGCPPAELLATLGPGAVPGLRFGAPGSACLHIAVASAVPGGHGETPPEQLLLWAACPRWDKTSHPHPRPSWSPAAWCGGWGTQCRPVAPLDKFIE